MKVTHLCLTLLRVHVACQTPLSMEFSRQEYWSGLPRPSPGDLPNLGMEPGSSALQADSLSSGKGLKTPSLWQFSEPHKSALCPPCESSKILEEKVKSKISKATLAAVFPHKMNYNNSNRGTRPKFQPQLQTTARWFLSHKNSHKYQELTSDLLFCYCCCCYYCVSTTCYLIYKFSPEWELNRILPSAFVIYFRN